MNTTETQKQMDEKPEEKGKPSPVVDAVFIGFLGGIVVYSALANTWGFLTLIPLAMIYVLLKKSKKK